MSSEIDDGVRENWRALRRRRSCGEAFGDGGLANAGIAHEQRVVLAAAAEDLDRALNFRVAADERVDLALARLLVEVDAIGLERLCPAAASASWSSSSSARPSTGFGFDAPGFLATPWLM